MGQKPLTDDDRNLAEVPGQLTNESALAAWPFLERSRWVREGNKLMAAGVWKYQSLQSAFIAACLTVAAAVFIRLELLGGLGTRLAYITLYPAVTVAAVIGGYRAGALATIFAALAASAWLSPLREAADWMGLAVFVVACVLIVGVTDAMHRAQTRALEAEAEAKLASAVRESEARLKAVVDTAVDGIVSIDGTGIIQSVNPAAARLFGYQPEEAVGQNISLLMPEPHRSRHDQYLRDYLCTGKGKIIGFGREVQGLRKDGGVFPMNLAVSETTIEGERLFIGLVRDISERKRAEERQQQLTEELKNSESDARRQQALFEGVFNSAPDAIVLTDMERRITMVNAPFTRLFGYNVEEVGGSEESKLYVDRTEWRRVGDHIFANTIEAPPVPQSAQFRRKNGEVFPGEIVVSGYSDQNGAQLGYVGIIRDVALERKREEAQRQSQKLEVIGQLTGGVAHDFNNLLIVIIGNLEFLEMRLEEDAQRALLRKALDAADMGQRLTDRLLTFARRQTLAPERTSLNQIVLSLTDMLRRTLGPSIELTTALSPSLWPAVADRGQIESAILNLALNARDAMPQGGKLIMRTSNMEVDAAPVDADLQSGRYVRLTVGDTGEGMPPEVRAHGFEPFFTTKGTGRGTGLGLATIYGFAKQSGGSATIDSDVGKGTTVDIFLPAEPLLGTAESAKKRMQQ